MRIRIIFLIFRGKKESDFNVKAKILCLIKEYRNTNGQDAKAIEGNDSFNENFKLQVIYTVQSDTSFRHSFKFLYMFKTTDGVLVIKYSS